MPTITASLGDAHRRCDELFAEMERLVSLAADPNARAAHEAFVRSMECHFSQEEEVLFPAFESAMGNSAGPTAVMRHEHRQMRELFGFMAAALNRGDGDAYLAASETLLILMQQHNAKEEQILYPMSDRVLVDRDKVVARMQALSHGDCR